MKSPDDAPLTGKEIDARRGAGLLATPHKPHEPKGTQAMRGKKASRDKK